MSKQVDEAVTEHEGGVADEHVAVGRARGAEGMVDGFLALALHLALGGRLERPEHRGHELGVLCARAARLLAVPRADVHARVGAAVGAAVAERVRPRVCLARAVVKAARDGVAHPVARAVPRELHVAPVVAVCVVGPRDVRRVSLHCLFVCLS